VGQNSLEEDGVGGGAVFTFKVRTALPIDELAPRD
jgi:hypothetical protein